MDEGAWPDQLLQPWAIFSAKRVPLKWTAFATTRSIRRRGDGDTLDMQPQFFPSTVTDPIGDSTFVVPERGVETRLDG